MTTINRYGFGGASLGARYGYPLGSAPTPGTTTPGAMVNVVVSSVGDGQATLTWEPPADASMVTGFRVGRDNGAGGAGWETIDTPEKRSRVFYNLTNGLEYDLYIEAVNDDLTGPRTTVPATPGPTPPSPSGDTWAASRNVYTLPFPATSIWLRPIGVNATYVNPNFGAPTQGGGAGFKRVQCDDEHHCLRASAPIKTMGGGGAAAGQQVRVEPSDHNDGSLNHCWAYLSPIDNLSVWQGQPLTLSAGGNPSTTNTRPSSRVHLTNSVDDARLGSHGGSGLSTIGGSLRPGDLNGADPIRHALKINVYGYKYLSQHTNGYRWPAVKADKAYAGTGNGSYQGSVQACRMGSLLALKTSYSTAWITHPKVLKIATALKHYGAYIVDNTAWDVYAFCMDETVRTSGEFPYNNTGSSDTQTFHSELLTVIQNLWVIDNNAEGGTTSGGGAPVASNLFAPDTFTGLPA